MLTPQKISAFRIAYKKKHIESNPQYLMIGKICMTTINTQKNQPRQTFESANLSKIRIVEMNEPGRREAIFEREDKRKRFNSERSQSIDHVRAKSWRNRKKSDQLKTLAANILFKDKGGQQNASEPIHSRRTERFKVLSGSLKKHKNNAFETLRPSSLDSHLMNISRQTLHDFNEYSIKYISKIQKQAARLIKTAEKNKTKINFGLQNQSQHGRRIKKFLKQDGNNSLSSKYEICRPWSRQKKQWGQNQDQLNILILSNQVER